eukprot:4539530-Prymnesium_polylepis.1
MPAGHIDGAYFIESLAFTGRVPPDIMGCRPCNIAVYCRTGQRSRWASAVLENNGFSERTQPENRLTGRARLRDDSHQRVASVFAASVYDIQGVTQWDNAGLPLVVEVLEVQPAP